MTDDATSASRGQAALLAFVASAAWLSPLAIDRLMRWTVGHGAFDWPWLALHFADTVTAIGLIAALSVAILMRRASDQAAAIAKWGGLAALAFAFGLVPVVKLNTGLSSDIIMAGLLPALDAQSYFAAALNFLQTGHLTEWATRRPLTATQLAGLLMLTGEDFRLVLLLLIAGCGAATLLVVAVIYRAYGWVAAALGAVSLLAFIYQTLGSTMSESLGFTAGGAGFVLLWEGARKARPGLVLGGLALLSIGLTARAGALFVLPTLALWTGWRFAAAGRRFHWAWAVAALAAGSAGFIVSQVLIKTIGAPGQLAFSNFASTLYGLAVGGAPWTQVFVDAPQLMSMPEGEQAMAIYRLAWAHALQSPLDPIIGVLVRYNEFFFSMRWHSYVPNNALRLLILVLAVSGIIRSFRHRREPLAALLLAGLAGILLSVPFLGDGGSRVFAASHAFSAALVAVGAVCLRQWLARPPIRQEQAADGCAISAAAWMLASAAIVPLLAALASGGQAHPPARVSAAPPCAPGETALRAVMPRHGAVLVCPPGGACPEGIRFESLERTNIWKNAQVSGLKPLLPARIAGAIEADTSNGLWLLATADQAMPEGPFAACVKPRAGWLELMPSRAGR